MEAARLKRQMGAPLFLSQLKIYNGTFSDEGLWRIFMCPFVLILSPVTWFMILTIFMPQLWFGALLLSESTIFTVTYRFSPAQIGLANLGGLVGIILAVLVNGPLSDRAIVWMSQRNREIYEPEYRLVFMLSMLFGVFGYVGWAVGIEKHMPWIGAIACFAMVLFSTVASTGAATTYVLDTHSASDALHILSLVHSAYGPLSYGASFFVNRVFVARGFATSLLILGACQAVCCLSSVPMTCTGSACDHSLLVILAFRVPPGGKAGVSASTSDFPQSRPAAVPQPEPDSKLQ